MELEKIQNILVLGITNALKKALCHMISFDSCFSFLYLLKSEF